MIITGQSLCWVLTIELTWIFTCRNYLLFSTPTLLIALPSSLQPDIETLEVLKCDVMTGVSPLLRLLPSTSATRLDPHTGTQTQEYQHL